MIESTDLKLKIEPDHKRGNFLITIAIPTYNQPENLESLCLYLDKVIGPKTSVIILDNSSEKEIDFKKLSLNLKVSNFKFYRNKIHLNPWQNLLKAAELCDTPWVYLLGDSKIPKKNTLRELEQDCINYKDASTIVYKFRNKLSKGRYLSNFHEIKNNNIDIGDFLLLGNSLISKSTFKKYLPLASEYNISRIPHIIFHLMTLAEKKKVYLSEKKLVHKFVNKKDYDPKLYLLRCWANFSLILSLPLPIKELKILSNKIINMENFNSRINLVKFSLLQIFTHKRDIRPYLLRIIRYRYFYTNFSYEKIFIYFLYLISLIFTPFLDTKNKKID